MQKAIGLCALILFFLPDILVGQDLNIVDIQQKGSNITIQYNLIDERVDRRYSIRLYNSLDNYIQPMELVSGDVGVDIGVGGNKKIEWQAKEELGIDFRGGLNFELKGHLYVPFVELEGIEKNQVFKRGVGNDLVWFGGRGDNILSMELYQGEQLVRTFDERPNTGNTTIMFPTNVKPGDNYRLRVSDSRNRDEVVYSNTFTIKRKIPLGLKLGATFLIGVGAGILIKSLIPVTEPDIPGPPTPELL